MICTTITKRSVHVLRKLSRCNDCTHSTPQRRPLGLGSGSKRMDQSYVTQISHQLSAVVPRVDEVIEAASRRSTVDLTKIRPESAPAEAGRAVDVSSGERSHCQGGRAVKPLTSSVPT